MSIGKNISNEIRKFHEGFGGTTTSKDETPPSKPAKRDKPSKPTKK